MQQQRDYAKQLNEDMRMQKKQDPLLDNRMNNNNNRAPESQFNIGSDNNKADKEYP